ncbi:MAG: ATP-binding protein [Verrucomicrobiota bacterium]
MAKKDTEKPSRHTEALNIVAGKRGADTEQKARLLSVILNSMPLAVFVKDAGDEFRFILWNKKNAEITGISEKEALGKTDYDIFQKETADYFRQVDKMVMDRGELLDIPEEKILSPTLGKRFVHTVKLPVSNPELDIDLVVGITEDITEVKAAREELERFDKELAEKEKLVQSFDEKLKQSTEELRSTQLQLIQAEKMESVGRLAAGVAHEVKNPLALLLMGVEYLQGGVEPGDDNVKVILKEMREAIERADGIVRGLVDFSSSRQLDLKPASINSLLEHSLLLVRHELTRSSIQVEKRLEADLPRVLIDNAKLEQVVVNLFMNAVHAMDEAGKGLLTVKTSTSVLSAEDVEHDEGARSKEVMHAGERVVVVEILDDGHGIPEDKVGSLFDPFFTTKPTGKGTGLGLTVVKKIIELHRGSLTIQNRDGEDGVRVKIVLRTADERKTGFMEKKSKSDVFQIKKESGLSGRHDVTRVMERRGRKER